MGRIRDDARLQERESRIMQYVEMFHDAHGLPPTQRDIADHLGLKSTSQVSLALERMERMGKITRMQGIGRSVRVVGPRNGRKRGKDAE